VNTWKELWYHVQQGKVDFYMACATSKFFRTLWFTYLFNVTLISLVGNKRSRGSSGSIVSDYGLDDWAIEVQPPTGADFSSSPCIQTGSGAHPASYPMGTGGSFPGGKVRPGRDADHSPPSSAKVMNE
jgi:hypothetical protein